MTGYFVRRVPHHPRIYLPPEGPHIDGPIDGPTLVRRVDVRPGRFIVDNPLTKTPDWSIPAEFMTVSGDQRLVGPLHPALHLARVEAVGPEGIDVNVWEVPNGREGATTLTHEQLDRQPVEVGDTLRIYTWVEIPLGPANEPLPVVPRIHVQVTPRTPLTEQELALLAALAGELGTEDQP